VRSTHKAEEKIDQPSGPVSPPRDKFQEAVGNEAEVIPSVMLTVKGMMMMVRKAGRSPRSGRPSRCEVTDFIIRKPTMISAADDRMKDLSR